VAILRRFLYAGAAVWVLSGLAVATTPRFWLVTVFDQPAAADYGYVRMAGVEAIALALVMVMVAHHAEQAWWWSWAAVIASGGVAVTAGLNAAIGLPDGVATGLWWLIAAVNGVLAAGLVWGLAVTGTERPPV
jgi:hypothetical protein